MVQTDPGRECMCRHICVWLYVTILWAQCTNKQTCRTLVSQGFFCEAYMEAGVLTCSNSLVTLCRKCQWRKQDPWLPSKDVAKSGYTNAWAGSSMHSSQCLQMISILALSGFLVKVPGDGDLSCRTWCQVELKLNLVIWLDFQLLRPGTVQRTRKSTTHTLHNTISLDVSIPQSTESVWVKGIFTLTFKGFYIFLFIWKIWSQKLILLQYYLSHPPTPDFHFPWGSTFLFNQPILHACVCSYLIKVMAR